MADMEEEGDCEFVWYFCNVCKSKFMTRNELIGHRRRKHKNLFGKDINPHGKPLRLGFNRFFALESSNFQFPQKPSPHVTQSCQPSTSRPSFEIDLTLQPSSTHSNQDTSLESIKSIQEINQSTCPPPLDKVQQQQIPPDHPPSNPDHNKSTRLEKSTTDLSSVNPKPISTPKSVTEASSGLVTSVTPQSLPRPQKKNKPKNLRPKIPQVFQCTVCSFYFKRPHHLFEHLKSHSKKHSNPSPSPTKTLPPKSADTLSPSPAKTSQSTTGVSPKKPVEVSTSPHETRQHLRCKFYHCSQIFSTSKSLTAHEATHALDKNLDLVRVHKCPHCPLRSYRYASSLEEHLKVAHPIQKVIDPSKSNEILLDSSRGTTQTLSKAPQTTTVVDGNPAEEESRECRYCHKILCGVPSRIEHERLHTGEKPIKCPHCSLAFASYKQKSDHRRKFHSILSQNQPLKIVLKKWKFRSNQNGLSQKEKEAQGRSNPSSKLEAKLQTTQQNGEQSGTATTASVAKGGTDKKWECRYCIKVFCSLHERRLHEVQHIKEKPPKPTFRSLPFPPINQKDDSEDNINSTKLPPQKRLFKKPGPKSKTLPTNKKESVQQEQQLQSQPEKENISESGKDKPMTSSLKGDLNLHVQNFKQVTVSLRRIDVPATLQNNPNPVVSNTTQKEGKKLPKLFRSNPRQCHYCPKILASKFNRREHERTHTGEKSLLCPFCPERFATSDLRSKHKFKAHAKLCSTENVWVRRSERSKKSESENEVTSPEEPSSTIDVVPDAPFSDPDPQILQSAEPSPVKSVNVVQESKSDLSNPPTAPTKTTESLSRHVVPQIFDGKIIFVCTSCHKLHSDLTAALSHVETDHKMDELDKSISSKKDSSPRVPVEAEENRECVELMEVQPVDLSIVVQTKPKEPAKKVLVQIKKDGIGEQTGLVKCVWNEKLSLYWTEEKKRSGRFECSECGGRFYDWKKFHSHFGGCRYICSVKGCKVTFTTAGSRVRHLHKTHSV